MRASEKVYTQLRGAIINWALEPGAALAEVELSDWLGVSRTPVREAVAKLVADGLAVQNQGRGTVVADVSLAAVEDMFALRRVLDRETARLAATNATYSAEFADLSDRFNHAAQILEGSAPQADSADADPSSPSPVAEQYYQLVSELDDLLLRAADNEYLTSAVTNLRLHLQRVRKMAKDNTARLAASAREHQQIAAAVGSGSVELAEATTEIHLHQALEHILSSAEQHTTQIPTPNESPITKE